jgi:hypothetical protein
MIARLVFAACVLIVSAVAAEARPRTLFWTPGWDEFDEPLDLEKSTVTWSVNQSTKMLNVVFTLIGGKPNKLYQVGYHIFNFSDCPGSFGQFRNIGCSAVTLGGVTRSMACIEFGVVTTDMSGNGSFKVSIGPLPPGVYAGAFGVRNGAGCGLAGGGGISTCNVVFLSPGPFGTATRIVVN